MSNFLSPKTQFLAMEQAAKEFRSISRNDNFKTALLVSLAEYASKNPGADQLKGANAFVGLFLNIAEIPQPPSTPPDKARQLTHPK